MILLRFNEVLTKVQKGMKIKIHPALRFFIPIGIKEKSGFQNDNPSTQDASSLLRKDSSLTPTVVKQPDYGPFCANVSTGKL